MTQPIDYALKSAGFKTASEAADLSYSDAVRVHYLTLSSLYFALGAASSASAVLATLQSKTLSVPLQALFDDVAAEIAAVELLTGSISIEQAKSDAAYAANSHEAAKVARTTGEAASNLAQCLDKLVQAAARVASAQSERVQLTAPDRPKRRYAVAKADFTDTKGGSPVKFYKGIHAQIDHESEKGIRVEGGGYAVFFTHERVAELFDIIER